ncbi:class I SAM-dependent methyltransferase [Haloarcula sp. S1AR25-5A]|uniref:Class I SAM-dependent methyltransferase n=1 Tax=Haloarcula terrestris TaxID=2950533 RepID=A0AAE4ETS7_9EURY|nr:class I SAM-dependent methyltransferase [Haloarcula terrestris]MDS0219930.1 class I SAM-dependent methyltransferase [Haloarcula terrestris]
MSEATWDVQDGAIVERPRNVRKHPLLNRIYERHDDLIAEHLPAGRTLEIAFGQHMHPRADIGLEGWPSNAETVRKPALAGDARALPFADDAFDAVVGRRFLHHVPPADRPEIVQETARVLRPGGRVILLEGTPGLYRTLTKGLAFRLGLLEEDTDIYGHLSEDTVTALVDGSFDVVEKRTLGSPLMLASISESDASARLLDLYERTQYVKWWTFVVGEQPDIVA